MAELYLDVHLELDPAELYAQADPTRAVAELSRRKAESEASLRNAVLRHPEPIDVYSRPGVERLTGKRVVLVATRWIADGNA